MKRLQKMVTKISHQTFTLALHRHLAHCELWGDECHLHDLHS